VQELHSHVITQTAQAFVTKFVARCIRANTDHQRVDLSLVPQFDVGCVLPRYRHSGRRLLLLDFESTLWVRDITREGLERPFELPEDALALLEKLADDPRNEVWLLSGLPVRGVMEEVAERVGKLGIMYVSPFRVKKPSTVLIEAQVRRMDVSSGRSRPGMTRRRGSTWWSTSISRGRALAWRFCTMYVPQWRPPSHD
jgi:hypothetical protein